MSRCYYCRQEIEDYGTICEDCEILNKIEVEKDEEVGEW